MRAQGGADVVAGQEFEPEVEFWSMWFPICNKAGFADDNFGAVAVCKKLGFTSGTARATGRFHQGTKQPFKFGPDETADEQGFRFGMGLSKCLDGETLEECKLISSRNPNHGKSLFGNRRDFTCWKGNRNPKDGVAVTCSGGRSLGWCLVCPVS